MIEKHGWTVAQWDSQEPEEKAMVMASLEYWAEQREKEQKELAKNAKKNRKRRR